MTLLRPGNDESSLTLEERQHFAILTQAVISLLEVIHPGFPNLDPDNYLMLHDQLINTVEESGIASRDPDDPRIQH